MVLPLPAAPLHPWTARSSSVRIALKASGWVLLLWMTVFWRLGYLPLLDPDEAHYAEITREMMSAREFVVPLLDGQPHIDKPVLFHWLQAASFGLLGQTEFAARLPSALSALALFAITYWCGATLFGKRTGERAALFLATIPATFALSYVGVFDMLFAVCLFGALTALSVSAIQQRPWLQYLAFLFVAGAVLTKGPAALILLAITAGLCLLHPTTRRVTRELKWAKGTLLILVLAAPWFLVMWYKFGTRFVDQYVLYNNLQLFGKPLYRSSRYPFFYGRVFLTAFLPWSPILLARIADVIRSRTRIRDLAFGEIRPRLVGPDRCRVLQLFLVQARYVHLPGRTRRLPPCSECVAARPRGSGAEPLGAERHRRRRRPSRGRRHRALDPAVSPEPPYTRLRGDPAHLAHRRRASR